MRELIYYPGFEVRDPNWLKFALLYIDQLSPIIPPSGDRYLSQLYRRLADETDLIVPHRPGIEEGYLATADAIDVVERIARRPRLFSSTFGTPHIIESWKQRNSHNFTLFREKYTAEWEEFCVENGLGSSTGRGVLIPRDLGLIYMTLLTQAIADSRGISPITDYPNLDRFSVFCRRASILQPRNKLRVAQAVLELRLPENLDQIEMNRIIELRNQRGFKEQMAAFHTELDSFLENVENGTSPEEFVDGFNRIWQEFSGDVLKLGVGVLSFGLGVWIKLSAPQVTSEEYLKLVAGGASLAVGSAVSIRGTWKRTETRRYTRKYLTELKKLKPKRTPLATLWGLRRARAEA